VCASEAWEFSASWRPLGCWPAPEEQEQEREKEQHVPLLPLLLRLRLWWGGRDGASGRLGRGEGGCEGGREGEEVLGCFA
jgi:hypothetical protein